MAFYKKTNLAENILPIDFSNKKAMRDNVITRQTYSNFEKWGVIAIFPAGELHGQEKRIACWKMTGNLCRRLINDSKCDVLIQPNLVAKILKLVCFTYTSNFQTKFIFV